MTVQDYLKSLATSKYEGDIHSDMGSRVVASTDNSIYQLIPKAVLYPKSHRDIELILNMATQDKFKDLTFTAKGGATGTNGQSLTHGIVIDLSKYMHGIISLDIEKKRVKVQPGLVLDSLNDYLKEYGLTFAPSVAPSSRATIGGMVGTDACGRGSLIHGRTLDHIHSLKGVYANGQYFDTEDVEKNSYLNETLKKKFIDNKQAITTFFKHQARYLTGYNLKKAYQNGKLSLKSLLCGAEGTLGIITEITLDVIERPKKQYLGLKSYNTLDKALEDLELLQKTEPLSIELVETKLSKDFKEFKQQGVLLFIDYLKKPTIKVDKWVTDPKKIKHYYNLRNEAVGLATKDQYPKQAIAFMEDTVVPLSHLKAYLGEIRELLTKHKVFFSIYGHLDVGCMHIRPALDLIDIEDEKLMRKLSDDVFKCVQKYKGLFYGEHGKGKRYIYDNSFYPKELLNLNEKIKTLFDARHRLNPGKLGSSDYNSDTLTQDLRGQRNRNIPESLRQDYKQVFECNGNGKCVSVSDQDNMCPTYKATRDKRYSPKGRSDMIREWLKDPKPIENDLKESLDACLSCKICETECPVACDISTFKSSFLNTYYKKHLRSIKTYTLGYSEHLAVLEAMYFRSVFWQPFKTLFFKILGISRLPKPNKSTPYMKRKVFRAKKSHPSRKMMLLQDMTTIYEPEIVDATIQLFTKLQFEVHVMPYLVNGKSLEVRGFTKAFKRCVKKTARKLNKWAEEDVAIVGLDPSIVNVYQEDYTKILGEKKAFNVIQLDQFIKTLVPDIKNILSDTDNELYLFEHCIQSRKNGGSVWETVLTDLGFVVHQKSIGCCGMAGSFGLDKKQKELSELIYDAGWRDDINNAQNNGLNLAIIGFSCRHQIRENSEKEALQGMRHPIQYIRARFKA